MKLLKKPMYVFRKFEKEYIILNIVYYGLIILGMIIAAVDPKRQNALLASIHSGFNSGGFLSSISNAYSGKHILSAIVLTFIVNLFIASLISITLPSLLPIVGPILGLIVGMYRAVSWGIMFSPIIPQMQLPMLPHWLLIILEGQTYIMAMLAAYIMLKAFLVPAKVDAESRKEGYTIGLKYTSSIYIAVIITLAFAAIYEAFEVILIVPKLR
jgi:hypothetical protein